tara:strand:+ start:668 stop:1201 length:534 start_codon:yes stop_codon:yes gene_type:complete
MQEMKMPSGKVTSVLETATPGQSLTKPMGEYPWEKPPAYTTPDEAIAYLATKISTAESMSRLFAALEEGITISSFVEALVLSAFAEGKFNPNVAELIKEDLRNYIKLLAEEADIDFEMGSQPDTDDLFEKLADLKNQKQELSERMNPSEPAETAEEEIAEEPTESLMASKKSLMSRG